MDDPLISILHDFSAHHSGCTITGQEFPDGYSRQMDHQPQESEPGHSAVANGSNSKPTRTFADLPAELREMIWQYALPEPRVFNALVYAAVGLKMLLLDRGSLRMPLAHVCFESRQVVKRAGYVLAFRDEDQPDDPGVFFHPQKDIIERTIWGRGDFWGLR